MQRAVDLDPSHLSSWLALAISFTNDNNRQGTYDAVYEWVSRNGKYDEAVMQFRSQIPEGRNLTLVERYNQLIECLITMARSDMTGDIDADIQIALAVLLNTNEVSFVPVTLVLVSHIFLSRNTKRHKIASELH